MPFQYIHNPDEIYRQSFRMIDELVDVSAYEQHNASVIKRMVHACGIPELTDHIHCHADFAASALKSLEKNCTVFTDCEMVLAGIMKHQCADNIQFSCTLNHQDTRSLAQTMGTTRSAAAVELWQENIDQAIVVIGNAPTALFHLLEILQCSTARPAAIIGLPVGFVGAAESKQALIESSLNIPFITVKGRMGGSAIASAAFNALALQLR